MYDFENREAIFPAVHRSYKFSLLTVSNQPVTLTQFAFFLTHPRQVSAPARVFRLAPEEIALMNPNTLTCPVFRCRQDAELTKKIYQRVPILENESTGENPWGISFMAMFHMVSDRELFHNSPSSNTVPLYEAKMFHQFNHRWATYDYSPRPQGEWETRDVRLEELTDQHYTVTPRYWVDKSAVEKRLANKWNRKWLIGFRRIARATDERTSIFSLCPQAAFGDSVFLIIPSISSASLMVCLYG